MGRGLRAIFTNRRDLDGAVQDLLRLGLPPGSIHVRISGPLGIPDRPQDARHEAVEVWIGHRLGQTYEDRALRLGRAILFVDPGGLEQQVQAVLRRHHAQQIELTDALPDVSDDAIGLPGTRRLDYRAPSPAA
jgi:hypothetical protein